VQRAEEEQDRGRKRVRKCGHKLFQGGCSEGSESKKKDNEKKSEKRRFVLFFVQRGYLWGAAY